MQRLLGILAEGEPVSGEGRDRAEKTSAGAGLGGWPGELWTWDAPPRCPRLSLCASDEAEPGYALSWEGNTALGEVLPLVEDNSGSTQLRRQPTTALELEE